ncbi:MAG: Ig-like domain-containing protein [Prevotellaceae bacterium]|nr:Ig-like domain-containing protein [Prevotellaceae bacterium]
MRKFFYFILFAAVVISCAKLDKTYIDGGWFDEDPPKVLGASPADKATNVKSKKISIVFDEFIKVENPNENVIVSPPQIEPAEIKAAGKKIVVELKDTLKENTTYTVDFSDAITDNNENNPMGNYTYSFSTGNSIDTLEVSGYVLDAETLEPIQGILVGLYEAEEEETTVSDDSSSVEDSLTTLLDSIDVVPFDSTFLKKPFLRVARTDGNGHFVVKGVKEGRYKVYALKDQDNNFMLTPKSGEMMAFYEEVVSPWVFDDFRQDTTMLDSLRIKSIDRVQYRHFMPDNVMLMAFSEAQTDRAYLKAERKDAEKFTLFYSYGDTLMPEIKGLNFDAENAFLIEKNEKQDTITYWLLDTALVNQDTLAIEMTFRMTDTLGVLQMQTETLEILAKTPYEKRLKEKAKAFEAWEKQQAKKKKRGEPYDSIMPPDPLKFEIQLPQQMSPDKNVTLAFNTPLELLDSAKIHLYIQRDSTWFNADWELRQKPNTDIRTFEIMAEWQPECEYSLEIDSAAFVDIYGFVSDKTKKGLKVKSLNDFGTFEVTMPGMEGKNVIVQLIENGEKLYKEVFTNTGNAKFFYLQEKKYFMRAIVDSNNNGVWDTGNFAEMLQPEQVYYYPKEINCRAKWNLTETWNVTAKPRNEQKPSSLVKTKAKKKQQRTGRNLKRAQDMGIELPARFKK